MKKNAELPDFSNVKLTSGDQMSDFCTEFGLGNGTSKKWTLKHFTLLADNLSDGEHAIFCFVGLHNYISASKHDGNFAYAITNKRILMAQQKLIGNNVQSIMVNQINDVTKKTGMLMGTLTIDTLKETFNVGVDKQTVDRISSSLNEIIYDLKDNNGTTITAASHVTDEIRKYKELLDDGIITQEEFDAKKKELLGL
ncbi:PH domain-containing protein [Enterococcus gallinarum]|uniref:PH domain-containing protein n=1 Tax=Enterococcus gallinarum TaxID=1353 RepID=UPI0022E15E74|nr:PH domain-containing protein [Enterococcus gallinarum]